MKKTFNINVAGFPFTIDDDAYTLLSDYLDTIEHAFRRQEDARELVNDIESRIAELLLERTSSGSTIITAEDVEEVIRRVGQPEEMIEEDETLTIDSDDEVKEKTTSFKETVTPPPYVPHTPPQKKKLYRDSQNAMLGGVCSGLAYYFNIDPTAVRLIVVLLTIISASTMGIVYLILWIVVPEARTPFERMQMMGEQPTVENIGKTVTDNFREESSTSQQPYSPHRPVGFGDALANFFGICAKILIIIGLVIAVPVLLSLMIGLVGGIFALIMFSTSWGWAMFGASMPEWYQEAGTIPIWGVVCGIGCILALGIPLYFLVRIGLKKNKNPMSDGIRNTLIVLWILGLITGAVAAGRIINLANEYDSKSIAMWDNDVANDYVDDEISASGNTAIDSIGSDSVTIATDSSTISVTN